MLKESTLKMNTNSQINQVDLQKTIEDIDEKIKDELRFFLTKQERTYQTNFDRKETTQNDFIRPKENPETL